jgi:hypothetical protein
LLKKWERIAVPLAQKVFTGRQKGLLAGTVLRQLYLDSAVLSIDGVAHRSRSLHFRLRQPSSSNSSNVVGEQRWAIVVRCCHGARQRST